MNDSMTAILWAWAPVIAVAALWAVIILPTVICARRAAARKPPAPPALPSSGAAPGFDDHVDQAITITQPAAWEQAPCGCARRAWPPEQLPCPRHAAARQDVLEVLWQLPPSQKHSQ